MLTSKEKAVMNYIYKKGSDKGQCLISPEELLEAIPVKLQGTAEEIPEILKQLEIEAYIESTESYRKKELIYCITLKKRGVGYEREKKSERNAIIKKIAICLGIPLACFLFVQIIKGLFGG